MKALREDRTRFFDTRDLRRSSSQAGVRSGPMKGHTRQIRPAGIRTVLICAADSWSTSSCLNHVSLTYPIRRSNWGRMQSTYQCRLKVASTVFGYAFAKALSEMKISTRVTQWTCLTYNSLAIHEEQTSHDSPPIDFHSKQIFEVINQVG